jgi:predicted MPP superfamily phosphohydrolase
LKRYFWKYFFPLLLVVIAIAEWTCLAWVLSGLFGVRFVWPVHVAVPILVYALNRRIVRHAPAPSGPRRFVRQIYTGFAFGSSFGILFLLVLMVAAGSLWLVLGRTGVLGTSDAFISAVRLVGTAGLLGIAMAMIYGYSRGQTRLWINEIEVPVRDLAPEFEGFRIVQISDVHLGNYMGATAMRAYAERVLQLEPDFIAITGDITDGLAHAHETFPALGALQAPSGVAAILGNHDIGTGADEVCEALELFTNFRVLNDDVMMLERGASRLAVIGLRDRGLDWARGVATCSELEEISCALPAGLPRILLSHRPDLFRQAAELGCSLVLSGHTHGGQLAIPWTRQRRATLARFMTRYPRGTYVDGHSTLHVNLGLGMTGQPVRVATPREITVITLRAVASSGRASSAASAAA